ncbi:MAG: hypothetical protein E7496_08145 [Ruminococcus sp.]|nr:hypothetical protein [Ruminococcus sp.]
MNKIIIQVFLPANETVYDIRVPESMYVCDLAAVLADLFSETAKGFYSKSDVNLLCFQNTGENLPPDKTLAELEICNRTKLIFV